MEAPVLVALLPADAVAGVQTQDRLDLSLLAALIALAIPLLVNLLTKQTASSGLKSAINVVGVALVSVATLWANPTGAPINFWTAANVFLASLAASFVAYKSAYKPLGVAGFIAAKTGRFGLGSPPTVELPQKGAEDELQVDHANEYNPAGQQYAVLPDNEPFVPHSEVVSTRDEHPLDLAGDDAPEDELTEPNEEGQI